MRINYGIFSVEDIFVIKVHGVVAAGKVAEGMFQGG